MNGKYILLLIMNICASFNVVIHYSVSIHFFFLNEIGDYGSYELCYKQYLKLRLLKYRRKQSVCYIMYMFFACTTQPNVLKG